MIYFIQHPNGDIKIGTTVNLTSRLSSLRNHVCRDIELLGIMPGGSYEEATIHNLLIEHKQGRSDWFDPAPAVLDYIKTHGHPWDGNDEESVRVRQTNTNVRSTPEWKAWLERFADFARKDYVDLVDEALVEHAKRLRFEEKPPRR